MTPETQRLADLTTILDKLRSAAEQHAEVRAMMLPLIEDNGTPEGILAQSASSYALNLGSSIADLATLIGTITDVERN